MNPAKDDISDHSTITPSLRPIGHWKRGHRNFSAPGAVSDIVPDTTDQPQEGSDANGS